jgi:DNA-binding GntR family transcriptional regulator
MQRRGVAGDEWILIMASSSKKAEAGANGQSVVDYTVDTITKSILEGHFAPGQRLIEAELTQRLRVSRGPLREALRRLAADGLIDLEPFRGATVTRVSRAELDDMFEVRAALECLAARLAAERIGREDNRARAKKLRDSIVPLRSGEMPSYLEENDAFHKELVELSGNSFLKRHVYVSQFQLPTLRAALFRILTPALVAQSVAQHRDIVDAILAGDPRRAQRAMEAHVRRTAEIARQLPDMWFSR